MSDPAARDLADGQELRVGIAGLGGAASLVLPSFGSVPGVRLAGAADIRPEARERFQAEHGLPAFESVEALCASPDVDAVWIETPNHLHCEHALLAAAHGKHIICAKPLATNLADCDRMIAAAESAGVQLLQGHSKIFDVPIRAMREFVASGALGRVIQVDSLLFNDWLQRPRLAEELDPALGGGIVLRQGPHLVDIAAYIVGEGPRSLRAVMGRWDANFDTAGNFTALLSFEGGAAAALTVNGYGFFDGTELHWGIGARGARNDPDGRGYHRRTAAVSAGEKYAAVDERTRSRRAEGEHPPFFGLTIVSCEYGVIRQSPQGLYVYTESGRDELPLPPDLGRAAELIELRDALREERRVFPDGVWAKATLETCLGIEQSSRCGAEVTLRQQTAVPL